MTIDARLLGKGGIGSYLETLLDELPADAPVSLLTAPGAVTNRPQRTLTARVFSLAEQWQVPRALSSRTLLHVPHYNIPLAWRGPLVVTIHDLIHLDFPEHFSSRTEAKYARWLMGQAIHRAGCVLTVSNTIRERICGEFNVDRSAVRVIPNKVRRSLLQAEESPHLPDPRLEHQPFFLYCGSFRVHKNVGVLIDAVKHLPSDVLLAMVAAKPWPTVVPDRVILLEAVSNQDLKALYRQAIALVQPSLSEGFGLPVLEAMTLGTPVIASDIPALREVAGDAPIYFASASPEEMSSQMMGMASDESLRRAMVNRGQMRAPLWNDLSTGTAIQMAYSEVA